MMKWLKRRRRDRRGEEIQHLVPEMLAYVKEHYVSQGQYCVVSSDIKYSLPAENDYFGVGDGKAQIRNMKEFARDAEKDMALYDSPALENTYHAWEKENSEYKSFSSEVVRMVKEKYDKTSDFYKAAGIDKRTYHKISSDYGYQPSRKTAFRCCIGLRLSAEEAEELLKLAGMAFSPSNPDDLVLKFCLEKGIRDIPGINYMLYRYANRPLTEEDKRPENEHTISIEDYMRQMGIIDEE